MKSSADTPTYNLKAVVQETGLKPDTLRAWERRYGLPEPQRTESGHRLYSQNDITLLKWLIARQEEGLSISRAVELWRRVEAEQADPFQAIASQIDHQPTRPVGSNNTTREVEPFPVPFTASFSEGGGDTIAQLRQAWIAHCLKFDEQNAERLVTQAFSLFPVEKVCVDLLQKGLAAIGDGWYEGRITVQQEHFASALAVRRLEALLAATPAPTRNGRLLVGCPPDEAHTFIPLILSLLLRRRGWDVIFLGANIPQQDFVLTTQTARPQLVVLTAQLLFTAAGLRELADLFYEARVPLAYGGMIFTQLPALQHTISGHYLGNSLDQAIELIEQLMVTPRLPLSAIPLSQQYEEALHHFRLRQALIESEVWQKLSESGITYSLLRKANINFSRDIIAALTLGDIQFMGPDLIWLNGLLTNHYQMPEGQVYMYLAAYLEAVRSQLHSRGAVLTGWLEQVLCDERVLVNGLHTSSLMQKSKKDWSPV